MTSSEIRSTMSLSTIFAMRMMGLFMIYPVFSIYARQLSGVTPLTIGIALGGYGLSQAIFQIPFGMLSDRVGRKPVITAGLFIFALGSAIAAMSNSIYGVIIGRVLQGTGAVGSTILAMIADLTREEHRTKAMAILGMSVGGSFAVALVLGPALNGYIGVHGIFWLTAILALTGEVVLVAVVPSPPHVRLHRDAEPVPALFRKVLSDRQLLRLDYGVLSLHAILTANFVALPIALKDAAGLDVRHQWYLYLPVLCAAVIIMVPFIILAEKYRKIKPVFIGAIVMLACANLALMEWHYSLAGTTAALIAFFAAFTLMEASLPSLISKVVPPDAKGTAMGVYSSSQFLGIFIGGTTGGWVYGRYGIEGVFVFTAMLAGLWFFFAITMKKPRFLTSYLLNIGQVTHAEADDIATRLTRIRGVAEAMVIAGEGTAYLKVDSKTLDEEALAAFSKTPVT